MRIRRCERRVLSRVAGQHLFQLLCLCGALSMCSSESELLYHVEVPHAVASQMRISSLWMVSRGHCPCSRLCIWNISSVCRRRRCLPLSHRWKKTRREVRSVHLCILHPLLHGYSVVSRCCNIGRRHGSCLYFCYVDNRFLVSISHTRVQISLFV